MVDRHGADSAGVAWHGRTLTPQPFAGDTGEADPALEAALEGYAAGREDLAGLVDALTTARLFVPVVAVAEGGAADAALLRTVGDSGADMAVITLTGKDGRRGLPVFTSVAALAGWDREARPVPVESARSAQAAVAEGCDVLLVDLGTRRAAVVPRSVVWALGQGRRWLPPSEDPDVVAAARTAGSGLPEVAAIEVEPAPGAELDLVLALRPGLDRPTVEQVAAEVRTRLRGLPVVVERAEAVRLRVARAAG